MNSPLLWTLIGFQIVMGLFDTLYHHELTERLAWRPSQRRELFLHGARNLIYSLLFFLLGWCEVRGAFAALIIGLLLVEVIVTLMDFVEEDMSRKLPASERVTHALLALNYGGILVIALPLLLDWARADNAIALTGHGLWSVLTALATFGTILFGLRDFAAGLRSPRLALAPAAGLAAALGAPKTILVTGATGFVGQRLVESLAAAGHRAIILVRDPAKALALRPPFHLVTNLDQIFSDTRIDAIVNLAGEPISNGLWTVLKRARMVESRVTMTADILRLIARLEQRPEALVNGSAIGWYGLWDDELLTETANGRDCFSRTLCVAWEDVANQARALDVRVVLLRIGLVLGAEGGILSRLLTPFEFGMGGPIGNGKQWMSWIARDDLVRLIFHAIATPELRGALNATAPVPVTNRDFARALGRALHRPAFMPMPAAPLRLAAGDFARELLLGGQRVVPRKALASGFVFRTPALPQALESILGLKAHGKFTAQSALIAESAKPVVQAAVKNGI
jgi:hypothetical protein